MEELETFRHEYKYICSQGDLTVLEHRLNAAMEPDEHAGADGMIPTIPLCWRIWQV